MPVHTESIEINRPPDGVWALLGEPERWMEGYVETRSRSSGYPGPGTQNDHVFRTRMNENVAARVVSSERPARLEEAHEGRTFSRRLEYRLARADGGTALTVHDDITFKGLAKLAGPMAFRDVRRRWAASLERLRVAAEGRP